MSPQTHRDRTQVYINGLLALCVVIAVFTFGYALLLILHSGQS